MHDQPAHIILRLNLKEPVEIGDFVGSFTALSSQYDKYVRENYPDLSPEAEIYVKEVRPGSIVADLVPVVGAMMSAIGAMDAALIVENFVRLYGARLRAFLAVEPLPEKISRADLRDFMDGLAAVARDPDGSVSVEAVVFEDKKEKIKAAIKFTTPEARRAIENIEHQRRQLEKKQGADSTRVLMVFQQANVKDLPVGKRTGEWVLIEEISDKPLPLVYASELAEQRIKHEIREDADNVFKKGFVVDVSVRTKGGRPVAYAVTDVHQVFDLPDE